MRFTILFHCFLAALSAFGATITIPCTPSPKIGPSLGVTGTVQVVGSVSCSGFAAPTNFAITAVTLFESGDFGFGTGTPLVRFGMSAFGLDPTSQSGNDTASDLASANFSAQLMLAGPTNAVLAFPVDVSAQIQQGDVAFFSVAVTVLYTVSPYVSSVFNPLMPTLGSNTSGFVFTGIGTGTWIDPPFTSAYDYAGTGGTLFSGITLPTGFGSSFNVLTGSGFSTSLGTFGAGASVDFLSLGGAQPAFRVAGISPAVDSANPAGFPLQVFFTTASGSLTQTAALPEPATWAGAMAGLVVMIVARRKRLS